MKMKNFKDPKEVIPFLEAEIYKHSGITVVDGSTYYDGCYIGHLFYYFGDECYEISKKDLSELSPEHVAKIKVISRRELDGDETYPLAKKAA